MRLDHLLSKEHWPLWWSRHARSDRTCLLAAHGWNIDIGARLNGSDLVRRFLWGVVGTVGAGRSGTCTLLGPEGPDNFPRFWRGGDGFLQAFTLPMVLIRWVWGFWPSVENYIVDASILETGLRSCFTKGESPRGRLSGRLCWRIHWSISQHRLWVVLHDSISCDFQVFKSKRWMPWHLEPKKDVVICDKPRGADKRAVIRGFPNGETPPGPLGDLVTPA